MSNDRGIFLDIAIVDFPFDLKLILVQHDIFTFYHFLLYSRLGTFIDHYFLLPVLIFLQIVLADYIQHFRRNLTHDDTLVTNPHLHFLRFTDCITIKFCVKCQLAITEKLALFQYSNHYLLQNYTISLLIIFWKLSLWGLASWNLLSPQLNLSVGY